MERTLKKLSEWLLVPGNSKALLASRMGYKSSETISRWVGRGGVPKAKRKLAMAAMKGDLR